MRRTRQQVRSKNLTVVVTTMAMFIVMAVTAAAQTSVPVVPTSVDVHLMPATGNPLALNVQPIATRNTVIATVSGTTVTPNTNCDKDPFVGPIPPNPIVNPVRAELDDPFTAGRKCWADIPPGPNGTGYRIVATLVAASCQPPGFPAPVSPCPSDRTLAVDAQGNPQLFNLAPIPDRPVAPTRLVVRP